MLPSEFNSVGYRHIFISINDNNNHTEKTCTSEHVGGWEILYLTYIMFISKQKMRTKSKYQSKYNYFKGLI